MWEVLSHVSYFDVNVFVYVVCFGLFLCCCVRWYKSDSFLMDLDFFDKLTCAEIEDQSADYWAGLMNNRFTNEDARRFCFAKARLAIREAQKLEKQKSKGEPLSDNVVKLF